MEYYPIGIRQAFKELIESWPVSSPSALVSKQSHPDFVTQLSECSPVSIVESHGKFVQHVLSCFEMNQWKILLEYFNASNGQLPKNCIQISPSVCCLFLMDDTGR